MEELIDQISSFARQQAVITYGLLFLSAFVENVFPPVPGDTVTLIGAYFVGRGYLNYSGVLFSTTLGSLGGFMTLFMAASRLGRAVLRKRGSGWIKRSRVDKVDQLFNRYGYWLIAANRFLSGIRSVISISAGIARLNGWMVAVLSFLSALIWNGVIIYAGVLVGENWQTMRAYLDSYNHFMLAVLAVLILGYTIYHFVLRRKKAGHAGKEKSS